MSEAVKFILAGDVFPVAANFELFREGKTEEIFGSRICELFKTADYRVCNPEGCLTDNGEPVEKMGPSVKAPTDTLEGFKRLGINAVTLANTHTMDFGKIGHDEMRSALENSGIEYFGTGDNADDIKTHITVELKGKRFTLYTVTENFAFNTAGRGYPGSNGYDEYRVCRELSELKKHCDFLIVLYHGGAEQTRLATPVINRRFHRMADSGADIVISQHTHAIGFDEEYNGSYLLYGQGNFCFNLSKVVNEYTATGLLLEIDFSNSGFSVKKHKVRRTDVGCIYDEAQDLSDFDERSQRHKKLMQGDREALEAFERDFASYSVNGWLHRLMRMFRGINPEDDAALAELSAAEAKDYLLSKYTKRQLMTIQMVLENDEFQEITAEFIRQAISDKE